MLNRPDKNELETYYHTVKSISKTSKHYNTTNPTVRKWLNAYDINRYSHMEASLFDTHQKHIMLPNREEFLDLFESNSLKHLQIIYQIGQATLYEWCKYFGCDIDTSKRILNAKGRRFNEKFGHIHETLAIEYSKTGATVNSLSQLYECSETTIKKLMREHGIIGKHDRTSSGQIEILEFIRSLGIDDVLINDRTIIAPLELDIVVPQSNVAIEYCGEYWHSEKAGNKPRNYHVDKLEKCENVGYTLLTIFESEWKNKTEIVKSIIRNKLKKTSLSIGARETEYRKLNYVDVKTFEIANHIQGTRPASEYHGLFYKNELVMTLSLGKSRFNKKYVYELIRVCSKLNTNVIGGFSKLFKYANPKTSVITYADRRYGTGKTYLSSGFIQEKSAAPNYWYFNLRGNLLLQSRMKFQKHKIPSVDMSKTEYQNMLDRGYDRIWDCGNNVYTYGNQAFDCPCS